VEIRTDELSFEPEALEANQEETNGFKQFKKGFFRKSAVRAGRNVSEH